ncbi:hypothetical protein CJA_1642 [Cellvibrio japonicus Ueda107]|uniref:Uncharacterized protein n=1 Tax=Cellvibrio japonicus (strain Ueda107) TaxID=498211 RepID=B3PER8_CELJU|nr:hypothetical protein CJA_1642 [Cellvibrio japonicus Ueda107]
MKYMPPDQPGKGRAGYHKFFLFSPRLGNFYTDKPIHCAIT